MEQKSNVGVSGKVLNAQAQEIIANVIKFMQQEAKEGVQIPIANFKARVLAATKVGEFSYRKILKQIRQCPPHEKHVFSTPKVNQNRSSPKSDPNDEVVKSIRAIIESHDINEENQLTLKVIHSKIQESGIEFKGGISSLRRALRKIGYRWYIIEGKGKVLLDSNKIEFKFQDSDSVTD